MTPCTLNWASAPVQRLRRTRAGCGADALSLETVKAAYGEKLALLGNADVRLLCAPDLEAVRAEVRRCLIQGGSSGYLLSSCNSIFPGMNPDAVREFFRCQAEMIASNAEG